MEAKKSESQAEMQPLLRADAAAAMLGLSTQRLAVMRLDGGGPTFIKVGRSVLYSVADLQDWLQSRRRQSTSDRRAAA